jgi:uncharacterized membrane protein YqjE
MSERQTPSLQELVGDALRDAVDLARKEFALFKAEMSQNISGMVSGIGFFAVAAIFALASLIWLTQALVYGIDLVVQRPWLSALIVGALLLLVAAIFGVMGRSRLAAAHLAPDRTIKSLKRDTEMLSERTSA